VSSGQLAQQIYRALYQAGILIKSGSTDTKDKGIPECSILNVKLPILMAYIKNKTDKVAEKEFELLINNVLNPLIKDKWQLDLIYQFLSQQVVEPTAFHNKVDFSLPLLDFLEISLINVQNCAIEFSRIQYKPAPKNWCNADSHPPKLLARNKDEINNLRVVLTDKLSKSDPLTTLGGLRTYQKVCKDLTDDLNSLRNVSLPGCSLMGTCTNRMR
jgi:hypothetical protein